MQRLKKWKKPPLFQLLGSHEDAESPGLESTCCSFVLLLAERRSLLALIFLKGSNRVFSYLGSLEN